MNMMIRRAGKPDIDALIRLLGELFSMETDFAINAEAQRAGLSLLLSDSDKRIIFVAADGPEIAGMVTAQLLVSTAAGGYGVLLEDLIVREKYRRCGLGGTLVDTVKAWAEKLGAKRIALLADQRNHAALDFYKRIGFAESSMRGFYLPLKSL